MTLRGALMVVGSASGVGKSTVSAALCRSLVRRGVTVAPFKAQNMSNHAAVTADGGEIGRAQAMQALAARVLPERRMNPILLKPSSPTVSHLVVMGDEVGTADAVGYGAQAQELSAVVFEAFAALREDHEVVVAEGAGGAAEINLLDRDVVNLPLAAATGTPAILVVDIDRGGAFAAAYGTLDLLPAPLRTMVRGIVFNGFRGDPSLLDAGVAELEARTRVPVLGILPHLGDAPMLGVEDSLDVASGSTGSGSLRVAAVRLPHLANPSDLDPLLVEPDVDLNWTTRPSDVLSADLVVVPGSRATVSDLDWLTETELAQAIASTGGHVLGLCAGYQMLGETIHDDLESGRGRVPGLGLLPVTTRFEHPKVVRQVSGRFGAATFGGYEIRWGRPESPSDLAWLEVEGSPEGCCAADGRIRGTSVHGLLDSDDLRTALLHEVAAARDLDVDIGTVDFAAALDAQHERLADWFEAHITIEAIDEILAGAVGAGEAPGW